MPHPLPRRHTVRHRFTGTIAGAGTANGTCLVLGCWDRSPHGPFADVMVAHPDGHRELLAPDAWAADFVASTYAFDEVRVVPVGVRRSGRGAGTHWAVEAGPLAWEFDVGHRLPLGLLLRVVPGPMARSRTFAHATDAVARRVMPGVRTLGSAGGGRTEWYSARDLHRIDASRARWDGRDLGAMADVPADPGFGFGSVPTTPSVTTLTSTVEAAPDAGLLS